MKALIAGGAGFIGSHLTDALIGAGYDVICVDNFYNGIRANIAHLVNDKHFKLYEEDLCALEGLKEIFRKERPDHIFHLAANSDIQASVLNPAIEFENTYTTTYHLLECMRIFNVKKLFFASTSAVYGDKESESIVEDSCDLKPISYYGGAKLGCEGIISAYTYMNDLCSLVFRFPNVIGPRLTHGVIFDFVKRLKLDPSRLRILGDGTQSKPYLYVADLVKGIIQFMNVTPGVTIYNVGVETHTSVTRIADVVCEHMGLKDIEYEYTGGRGGWKGDVPIFSYNLEKIHTAGWHADHTSDDAVIRTVREVLP